MPTLKWLHTDGTPRVFSLTKPHLTLGRDAAVDIRLDAPNVARVHAQVLFDGRDFNLEEADREGHIAINGKKKRRGRLVHNDRVDLGEAQLVFSMLDEPVRASQTSEHAVPSLTEHHHLAGVRKLQEFSRTLMNSPGIDELFQGMLDAILEVTGAEKGFVLLRDNVDPTKLAVRASRKVPGKDAPTFSDSIVARVMSTGTPVIVSDALSDTQFRSSQSVIALQLSSVMCAPLYAAGEVAGVLYVGNDSVKGLFQRAQLDLLHIFASQASLIFQNASLLEALKLDKVRLYEELKGKHAGEIVGACASMVELFRRLARVATTDVSVLVTGETGTGKELVAREVHRASNRSDGPFIVINCGAIPENLIESELFGYVKGAFTGAVATRDGKFQAANGGTLFLDEIGELPLALQVKLLRALQERVVSRVGDTRSEKVDIRVVAATNRVLEDEVKAGRFREDLYYRLNVVNLHLPALRDRGDDVIVIAKSLLAKHSEEMRIQVRGFDPSALLAIRRHTWPGNVRELENRIRKALVLCDTGIIGIADLGLEPGVQAGVLPLEKAKEEFQRKYIMEVLARNDGNRTLTARDLGVDPRTIFRYLEKNSGSDDRSGGTGP